MDHLDLVVPGGGRVPSPAALRPGMRIELGDCRIAVAERLDAAAAGHTVSVPASASLVIDRPVVRRSRMGTLLAAFYVLIVLPLAVTLLARLWRRRITDVTPVWP
jgi:hypothetical protein